MTTPNITLRIDRTGDMRTWGAKLGARVRWAMFESHDAKILGAHLFVEDMSDDACVLTIIVSNAACMPDGTGHCGPVKFRSMWMEIEKGWTVHREYGPHGMTLVPVQPTGENFMQSGRLLVFRFAAWRKRGQRAAMIQLERTGAYKNTSSWGPAGMSLPRIADQEKRVAQDLAHLRTALANGAADPRVDLLYASYGGVCHLPGDKQRGAVSGQGIYGTWGYEQCPSAFQYHRLLGDRYAERSLWCFDARDGSPMTSDKFAAGAGLAYQPFEMVGDSDAEVTDTENRHICLPPAFDAKNVVHNWNQGSCAYEPLVREHKGDDIEHDTRALQHWCATNDLGRDEAHRFLLRAHAHYRRMSCCEIGPPASPGAYQTSLRIRIENARKNPGRGGGGRSNAWEMANAIILSWVSETKSDTETAMRWGRAILEWYTLAALHDTGLIGNHTYPYAPPGMHAPVSSGGAGAPTNVSGGQVFEEALVICWVPDLALRVGGDIGDLAMQTAKRAATSMWNNAHLDWKGAPPHYVGTAVDGKLVKQLTLGYGTHDAPYDPAHIERALARLHVADPSGGWLELLKRVGGFATMELKAKSMQAIADGKGALGTTQEWPIEALAQVQPRFGV